MSKRMQLGRCLAGLALSVTAIGPLAAGEAADWLAVNDQAEASKAVTYNGPVINAKFGHPAPPASLVTPIWQGSADRLNKITNGKLAFKVFGGGTLLGARDGFKAVRGGVAEWATCYVSAEGRPLSLSKIWEQPFVTPTNPMAGTRVAQELASKYEAPEFARQGVAWGAIAINTPADIMSKKPIRKLDDLRGMKVIYQGSIPDVAKALGFTQLNIAFPEIYTAMQQGVADAVIWIDGGYVPYKIYEVAKYRTKLGLVGGGISHCYNRDWYKGLSPDLQTAFSDLQEPMAQAITDISMVSYRKTADAVYKDKGVETITLSADDMTTLHQKMDPIADAYAADLEKDGVHAKDMLADIRRMVPQYDKMSPDELMKLAIEHPVKVQQ